MMFTIRDDIVAKQPPYKLVIAFGNTLTRWQRIKKVCEWIWYGRCEFPADY